MTRLAHKLRHRLTVMQASHTYESDGSGKRVYKPLITVWAGARYLQGSLSNGGVSQEYVDTSMQEGRITQEFIVRRYPLQGIFGPTFGSAFSGEDMAATSGGLGRQFDQAFGPGFKSMVDLNAIKTSFFLLLQQGGERYTGRLFRPGRVLDHGERKEYLVIRAEEIEEQGTGYPL